MSNSSPRTDLPSYNTDDGPILIPFTDFFYPVDPIKPASHSEDNDNAENQNIVNGNRYELLAEDLEVSDNMANEVREICYSATKKNCFVCKLCY